MKKISDHLITHHTPQEISILETYQIDPLELIQRVVCPQCSSLPMLKSHSKWYCPKCGNTSRTAYQQAIEDHLLIHGTITNQECRRLLALDNQQTIKHILTSMNLPIPVTAKIGPIITLHP